MPKKQHLKKILVIGSGPIVIGQAAEFDYSGTQAIHSLKEEGLEVILINSNPATIMTDKETADRVYIEPLTTEYVKKIIIKEKPDAILPTLGGQTALNLAVKLAEEGFLKKHHVELLGCEVETIKLAEDRKLFKELMIEIGEPVPSSAIIHTEQEALNFAHEIGYPVIVRPAFTLGGTGGGIAFNDAELSLTAQGGLQASPISQCLIERSIAGFKEIEFEVIRDHQDNCIIVCHMENFDPVGVHTGDSIVFAPCQTLTDPEVQMLRSSALHIIRTLKIAGGCNVQYALDPKSKQYFVIEVNPRVSRSSALASKATGYPIAKIAAKIAIGFNLDEIKNPITKTTFASFEPSLDYVVCKLPRWPFDKFENANRLLGTQMKATGEVMSLGRTMEEAILKAVRSLELKNKYLTYYPKESFDLDTALKLIAKPDDRRLFILADCIRFGVSLEKIHDLTQIDFYYLQKIKNIIDFEQQLKTNELNEELLYKAKKMGFLDESIAQFKNITEKEVRDLRDKFKIKPVYKMVDTCAGEFASTTPYYYSTYDAEDEVLTTTKEKIIVLGSGPIRIGQGIEFDYATVHAIFAIRELGMEAIIINNNPETVSTDFNISDRLYFEPLTAEDVINVFEKEKAKGVIVQFGGQTAINLAKPLHDRGIPILGTSLENIDRAENRAKFEKLLNELHIAQPIGTTVNSVEEAKNKSEKLGFPVIVRPSYVIGGRAMEIVYNQEELIDYLKRAVALNPDQPVLIDRYMIGREMEVDAICDGETVFIPGIMEHIEKAGVHSGDSIAVYPPQVTDVSLQKKLVQFTQSIARALQIKGFINIQFVIYKGEVYVLEVNPRASRTVPFLSKVTGIPMAKVATHAILGKSLIEQGYFHGQWEESETIAVKAPVFSFAKLHDVEIALGPEMKSTGEVMGHDPIFEKALKKALIGAGMNVPTTGTILVTLSDKDKEEAFPILERFSKIGFSFLATEGTAKFLNERGVFSRVIPRIGEAQYDIIKAIKDNECELIINTISRGRNVESDGFKMRRTAVERGILCLTSLDTTEAILVTLEREAYGVQPL